MIKKINIKEGLLEYYYCFDIVKKEKLNYVSNKISDDIINMIQKDKEGISIKKQHREYFQSKTRKYTKQSTEQLNKTLKPFLKVSQLNSNEEEDLLYEDEISTTYEDYDIGLGVKDLRSLVFAYGNKEEVELEDEIEKFSKCCELDRLHLGNEILYNICFLQPILVSNKEKNEKIYVTMTIHPSGQLILKYSIKVKNLDSFSLCTFNFDKNYICKIPNYILHNDKKIKYNNKELNLDSAISEYNNYIMKITQKRNKNMLKNPLFLENIIISDYEKKPQTFDQSSSELMEIIYFIINRPYAFINERTKSEYREFISNRYDISKYCSLFCGTESRILNLCNGDFDKIDKKILDQIDKCNSISEGLSPVLKLFLINRAFYNDAFDSSYSEIGDIKKIKKIQNDLLFSKDFNFFYLKKSYGSVKLLYKYIEENMTDFFPKKQLDERMELYTQIINSDDNLQRAKLDSRVSFGAVIITILLGLSATETLVNAVKLNAYTIVKNIYGNNCAETIKLFIGDLKSSINILNGVSFYFIAWIVLCILTILYFYKEKIIKFLKGICKTILAIIYNYYIENKYKFLIKLKEIVEFMEILDGKLY